MLNATELFRKSFDQNKNFYSKQISEISLEDYLNRPFTILGMTTTPSNKGYISVMMINDNRELITVKVGDGLDPTQISNTMYLKRFLGIYDEGELFDKRNHLILTSYVEMIGMDLDDRRELISEVYHDMVREEFACHVANEGGYLEFSPFTFSKLDGKIFKSYRISTMTEESMMLNAYALAEGFKPMFSKRVIDTNTQLKFLEFVK